MTIEEGFARHGSHRPGSVCLECERAGDETREVLEQIVLEAKDVRHTEAQRIERIRALAAPSTPEPSGLILEAADALDHMGSRYASDLASRLRAIPSTPEPIARAICVCGAEPPRRPWTDGAGDDPCRDGNGNFRAGHGYVAAPSTEPTLDVAWAEAEASMPPTGWPDGEGRWVLPSSDRSISLRWRESGDGYSEPHYEGWEATGIVYGFGGPDHRTTGDLADTPAAALRSLAARLAESR